MNLPLIVLIPWVFGCGLLLCGWFGRSAQVGKLEGQLAAERERYETMYQAFNKNIRDMQRERWGIVDNYAPSHFNVASRFDLGLTPPPGGTGIARIEDLPPIVQDAPDEGLRRRNET